MTDKKPMPDWLIRTIKTFVQVFLGTLIPAVCVSLNTPPATWGEVLPWLGGIFTPQLVIGDCLAAAICAMWNVIKEMNERAV